MALLASADSQGSPSGLWSGWSRFVPRLSWHDNELVGYLPADRSTTIAKSLAQAGSDAQLVLQAHVDPAHLVVQEPEAWHNQRPRRERSKAFNALGDEASLRRMLDPATLRSASDAALIAYIAAFLSPQQARQSDAVLLPAHVAGGYGSAAREGELRLATVATALVRRRSLAELDDRRKPLLVGIAIRAPDIRSPAAAVALARSYAMLDCDGFWVQFAGLSEAERVARVSACATFLFALQDLSDRRVFAVDTKNLTWPLLAAGLAGGCIGIGEREAWSGPRAASTKPREIKPTVVHSGLLRNFRVGGPHIAAAFRPVACGCGAHPAGRPPLTRTEIRRHALHVRLQMASAVTGDNAIAVIDRWLYDAGWCAYDLGLEPPPAAAYRAALEAAVSWRAAGES